MSEKTDPDVDELIEESKSSRRTNTPAASEDGSHSQLDEAVADALGAIGAGDQHPNITFRDENMVALLQALEETSDLSEIVEQASERTSRDADSTDRSEACRQLLRVGLREIDPDVLDDAEDGVRLYAQRQASDSSF
jgi:hypothetical protein